MISIRILPDAEIDIEDATFWYEHKEPNLGKHFLSVIRESFKTIQTLPLQSPICYLDIRVFVTPVFPFTIHYRYYKSLEEILILAVFHTSRNPVKWRNRTKNR